SPYTTLCRSGQFYQDDHQQQCLHPTTTETGCRSDVSLPTNVIQEKSFLLLQASCPYALYFFEGNSHPLSIEPHQLATRLDELQLKWQNANVLPCLKNI